MKKILCICCAAVTAITTVLGALTVSAQGAEDYMDKCEAMIELTADDSVFEEKNDVDYGIVEKLTYYSHTAERDTPVNVVLPPDYDETKEYPVLYILHGFTDTQDWMLRSDVSLVNMIGNLTSEGRIKEMIIVLPYIFCSKEQKVVNGFDISASPSYDNFINDLKTDLMGFINEKYPIKLGRENTAITGFSMGGRESLYIGNQMSDVFGYVGSACPAPGLTPGADLTMHPGQLKESDLKYDSKKGTPYLTFISTGGKDTFVGNQGEIYHNIMAANGEKSIWNVIPNGEHNASSVKQHLYNFTRMIFNIDTESKIAMSSLVADSEYITVSAQNNDKETEACIIVTYYDSNNTLVDVSTKNIMLGEGKGQFKIVNSGKGSKIKAFLWSKLNGLIPVSESKETVQTSAL